ncbi:MAG: hydantoinase/carbamoylase family amidase [Actinomycetota bacterium]
MVRIDADRLLGDLATLRTFGASGNGVVRPMFSDIDMAARRWLVERCTQAGLDAAIDGVGTVYGRSRRPGPAVVLGSHSDTQPEGGWLDGAMGVIHALEVARALAEDSETADLAVDVASWADEEGTYSSFLGARSFVGEDSPADLDHVGPAGETVGVALVRCGLEDRPRVRFDPNRHVAYLESHIEQGPRLDENGLKIGAVTAIVGIRALRVTFSGEQNHAGTTPMHRRKDAAAAMFDFGSELNRRMPTAAGDDSVWTMGQVSVLPGAQSIVPGHAEVMVQMRDTDPGVLDAMGAMVRAAAADVDSLDGVRVTVDDTDVDVAPAPMDPAIVDLVADAAESVTPGQWIRIPSAAGHDAGVLANHLPSAMVFVPSLRGISHDFAEDTDLDDIVLGAQVLAEATVLAHRAVM